MRFSILGDLRIRSGDRETGVAAGRERVLLALLLLSPNQLVPLPRVIEALWDDDPPPTARAQVHTCVSRLRRLLRSIELPESLVATDPAGYRVVVGDGELDATEFERLRQRGRTAAAAGDLPAARTALRAALTLWRGPALADVDASLVRTTASILDEAHTAAVEECVDVELRLGLAGELLAELTGLVATYPLRERLRAQLMAALAQVGRRADALAVYRSGRQVLADELGIEPGPELAELHRRILSDGEAAPAPAAAPGAARALPRDVPDFTGRRAVIEGLLATAEGAAVAVSIDGMAGTGKTALAVHVAHRLADRYPDGQLYVDLHGHSEHAPVEPVDALAALLRQLGVPAGRLPEGLDERVAAWRSELAGRRVLVVLDNARDSAQIAPLLPGSSGTLALITSRRRLAGLDGVQPVSLDVLPLDESIDLLTRTVGARVGAERVAAAELAQLCGRLPLALRLVAARLVHRPTWTVGDLAGRLRRTDPPLVELTVDGRSVAAAFTLSYRSLPATAQRMLTLLSLHPAGVFGDRAAAALADLPLSEAGDVLEDLVDAHLVEAPAAGRYRLHDLLRAYAHRLVPAGEADDALRRLLDYYLQSATAATDHMEPPRNRGPLRVEAPMAVRDVFANPVDANAWLQREFDNVVAAADIAYERGWHRHVLLIPRALWAYMYHGRCDDTFVVLHERALDAARRLGDPALEAMTRNYLGSGYLRRGRLPEAYDQLSTAIELRRSIGDRYGEASGLNNLVPIAAHLGRVRQALDLSLRAVAAVRELGMVEMEMKFLGPLSEVHLRLGDLRESLRCARLRMAYYRANPDLVQMGLAVSETGHARLALGDLNTAVLLLRRGLALKRAAGNQIGAAETLSLLGRAYRLRGRLDDALACQREALDEAVQLDVSAVEHGIRIELGTSLAESGAVDEAVALYHSVLGSAGPNAHDLDLYEEGRAHAGLAEVLRDRDPAAAAVHLKRALAVFAEVDTPEQHEVRARLAEAVG